MRSASALKKVMKTFAFDTSVVVRLLRGVLPVSAVIQPLDLYVLPATALGELLLGVAKSTKPSESLQLLSSLTAPFPIAIVDAKVAQCYAHIRSDLEKSGSPIPENDMWIAATAMANGATLLTCDAHFNRIPTLSVVSFP